MYECTRLIISQVASNFAHNMCMGTLINDWNQVRTAYHVARSETVSAAAKFLGVHHALKEKQETL